MKNYIQVQQKDFLPIYDVPKYVKNPKDLNYSLHDDDSIIVVVFGNNCGFVYPIKIMEKHRVIPFKVKKYKYTLTYCPTANSSILYDGEWGVSGYQYNSNMVIYNKLNELVPQILGSKNIKRKGVIRTTFNKAKRRFKKIYIINSMEGIKYENDHFIEPHDLAIGVFYKDYICGFFIKDKKRLSETFDVAYDDNVGIVNITKFKKQVPYIQCYAFAWELMFPDQLKKPTLNSINWHQKDKYIKFDDSIDISYNKKHDYYLEDINVKKLGWKSVTEITKQFYPFNARMIAFKLGKTKNKKSKYFGKSGQQILKEWDLKREYGSEMHEIIHNYLNHNKLYGNIKYIKEYKQFRSYNEYMIKRGYLPYKSEWYIYNEDLAIVGTIDVVYYSPQNDDYIIVEFKRTEKDIQPKSYNKKKNIIINKFKDIMKGFSKSDKYIEFSLQLGLYRHILKSYNIINCNEMHIVKLHPFINNYELSIVDPKLLKNRIERIF